mgnify:CR=1 FL=1
MASSTWRNKKQPCPLNVPKLTATTSSWCISIIALASFLAPWIAEWSKIPALFTPRFVLPWSTTLPSGLIFSRLDAVTSLYKSPKGWIKKLSWSVDGRIWNKWRGNWFSLCRQWYISKFTEVVADQNIGSVSKVEQFVAALVNHISSFFKHI